MTKAIYNELPAADRELIDNDLVWKDLTPDEKRNLIFSVQHEPKRIVCYNYLEVFSIPVKEAQCHTRST